MIDVILEAAVQIFEAYGYAAGTTTRIAERAGVSVGSLYQYFPDKDAILLALAHRHLAEVDAAARGLLAQIAEQRPIGEAIDMAVDSLVDLHKANPVVHRLLYDGGLLPAEIGERLARLERHLVDSIALYLSRESRVRPGDPRVQAWFVVQTIEHCCHRIVIDTPSPVAGDVGVAELKSLLRRYLCADPGV